MVFLGSRQDFAHLGYVAGRCPQCGAKGILTVYEAKRRLTFNVVLAVPVGTQHVLECRFCGVRFAVPKEHESILKDQLISADQLADYVARLPSGAAANGPGKPAGRTLYQILQVDPDAEPEVIEAAFKRLAFKYHPDRSTAPDAAERMRELIAARDVLTDPARRRAYDASIGIVRKPPRPPALRPDEV
ncbi:MAG TPA: DnaJ domain-containing protein [Thermomicrobiales bacterium]